MLQSKDCFSFSASRGSARHFFILLFLVTKRAARFRRVALKKLLSVFAEQPLCLPWHIYIIPHPFAKINTILSTFVHICPSLSNLRSECYIRRQVAISVRKLSALLKIRCSSSSAMPPDTDYRGDWKALPAHSVHHNTS